MPLFKTIVAEGSGNQDDTYVGAWSSSNWDTARNVYIANTRLDSQSNSLNGVYYTNALNTIPAALLNSIPTLPFSTLGDLDPIEYSGVNDTVGQPVQVQTSVYSSDTAAGYVPLVFRIKSTGLTVAALLDQVTFIRKV